MRHGHDADHTGFGVRPFGLRVQYVYTDPLFRRDDADAALRGSVRGFGLPALHPHRQRWQDVREREEGREVVLRGRRFQRRLKNQHLRGRRFQRRLKNQHLRGRRFQRRL